MFGSSQRGLVSTLRLARSTPDERLGVFKVTAVGDTLQVRVLLNGMPTVWCTDLSALSVGLQSGRDGLLEGVVLANGRQFDVEVGVREGRDGEPDFRGPLVHGRVGDRFLYIAWLEPVQDGSRKMFRRLKLYLSPVARRGWSSEGIGWDLVRGPGPVWCEVSGCDAHGGPACGTAELTWSSFAPKEIA